MTTPTRPAYIGIDVGGTAIKAVIADEQARALCTFTHPTFGADGSAMGTVNAIITEAATEASRAGFRAVAIGICTPGTVDAVAGVVRFAANLGWSNLPLVRDLEEQHRLPVALEHDARAAAAAEAKARGINAAQNMLFIPVGTGIAASLVYDRTVVHGASGAIGEMGHMIVYPDGEPCRCGQRGCVEAYAGGAALLRRYQREGGRAETVVDLVASLGIDPIAQRTWSEAIDALARGIHGVVALFDPATVVLGGGLAQAGAQLFQPLQERLDELLTWRTAPRLAPSVLGPSAGLIGALTLASPSGYDANALTRLATELSSSPPTNTHRLEVGSATP